MDWLLLARSLVRLSSYDPDAKVEVDSVFLKYSTKKPTKMRMPEFRGLVSTIDQRIRAEARGSVHDSKAMRGRGHVYVSYKNPDVAELSAKLQKLDKIFEASNLKWSLSDSDSGAQFRINESNGFSEIARVSYTETLRDKLIKGKRSWKVADLL
jgi:hypothetical protein